MDDCDGTKEFLCNILLVKALLQFLPLYDRNRTQEWLKKLQEADDNIETKTKTEYAFYLLVNVQNGTLSMPFNKSPPPEKLKPLCRILPDYLFEEVQKQLKVSYCRMNKMLNSNNDNYDPPELKCDPANFQKQQPRPPVGVQALFAVFSNCEDNETK